MDDHDAIAALAALAQPTRLRAFRTLVARSPSAVPVGELARLLDTPHNTLSTHLAMLARAGLVSSARQGRAILYRAELDRVRALIAFLTQDCCGGRPELCAPLVAELSRSSSSPTSETTRHGC